MKKLEYAQFLNIFYKLFADKFYICIPSRTNETWFYDTKSILFPWRHHERAACQKADSLIQLWSEHFECDKALRMLKTENFLQLLFSRQKIQFLLNF